MQRLWDEKTLGGPRTGERPGVLRVGVARGTLGGTVMMSDSTAGVGVWTPPAQDGAPGGQTQECDTSDQYSKPTLATYGCSRPHSPESKPLPRRCGSAQTKHTRNLHTVLQTNIPLLLRSKP